MNRKSAILAAVLFISFAAVGAHAAECWWNGRAMECQPGWEWQNGREWQRHNEMRREYGPRGDEWRRDEWRREEERRHQAWCARHPWRC